ncbi:MAG: cupin domain-containing protein [Candidatus Binatia bacterium]|nr:cupin domain-containing protein [Candidatus Binatia bacterium]
MATRTFEIQQVLKAYRKGLISDELFEEQMKELGGPQLRAVKDGLDVVNVFEHKGKTFEILQNTPHSQTGVFTLPAGYRGDRENTHKGDQLIYVIEGKATARVSGKEQEIKAGDLLMIPAGAPHTLRTGDEPFFGFTIFAPPEM